MPTVPLSADTVRSVAALARLTVSPDELDDLQTRLGAVLTHAQSLEALDLDDVEPLTRVGDAANRFAQDTPEATLTPEQALANAPDQYEQFFRVPKVLGDGGGS